MNESPNVRWVEQANWNPVVEHISEHRTYSRALVCGMGGSELAALLMQSYLQAPFTVHRDYDLPAEIESNTLVIASSYSGTTEETLSAADEALARGLPLAIIAAGGPLLALAREHNLPHVVLPDFGLEPRYALIVSMLAHAALMQSMELEERVRTAAQAVDHDAEKDTGETFAKVLYSHIPIFYATGRHQALAYMWKIKINETAKAPAFTGAIPEMCHNELEAYDSNITLQGVQSSLAALFIADKNDHQRSLSRMKVAAELLQARGVTTEGIWLPEYSLTAVLRSIAQADWASAALAHRYEVPAAATPLIKAFKVRMSEES